MSLFFVSRALIPKEILIGRLVDIMNVVEVALEIETNEIRHLCLGDLGGLLHLFPSPMVFPRHSQCRLDGLSISPFRTRHDSHEILVLALIKTSTI